MALSSPSSTATPVVVQPFLSAQLSTSLSSLSELARKLEAIDPFRPAGMADRILGMGDIVSFVDRMQQQYDEEEAKKLQKKIAKNQFDFNDFLSPDLPKSRRWVISRISLR
jgi:hypothetical protein